MAVTPFPIIKYLDIVKTHPNDLLTFLGKSRAE